MLKNTGSENTYENSFLKRHGYYSDEEPRDSDGSDINYGL